MLVNCGWSQDDAIASVSKSDEYDHLGYMAYVENVSTEDEVDHVSAAKIAHSYHLNANYEAEAVWYSKALELSGDNAKYQLKYAQALLASGRCEEAVDWYNKATANEGGQRTFVQNCGELPASMIFGVASVKPVSGLNSEHLDFSPVPVDGGMIFTSSRGSFSPVKRKDKWTKDNFTDLFFVKKTDDGFGEPTRLFGKINKKYHDGVAALNEGGNEMYFTRNNLKGKNSKKYIDLKIYKAEKNDEFWKGMEEVDFNMEDYSTAHPALSKDGNTMVFSSNRPGGQGGMDLYVTNKSGDSWTTPVNLGPTINSADDEIFPYVDKMGRLFFSSNGWAGAGGLDLFVSKATQDNNWTAPENLGAVMNSDRDDFGIWVADDGKHGYFSSNRQGSLGGDDIYSWTAEGPPPPSAFDAAAIVVDAETNAPIPGAEVKMVELIGSSGVTLDESSSMTPTDGVVPLKVWNGRKYIFNVLKEGYQPKNLNANAELFLTEDGIYKIPMEKIAMVTVGGLVTDASSGSPVTSANVELMNLCDNSIELYRSDASGKFSFETLCGCDYKMVATKDGFVVAEKTIKGNCEPRDISIAMITDREIIPTGSRPVKTYSVGEVIRIRDLYYDYDKSNIRPDAALRLDKVVSLMNRYPSMNIELGSHTDARGNDSYNSKLSQRRADSAVRYIISKGIDRSRLSARGYGEREITNHCVNGVNCKDETHEENRRTEIRITSIEDGVEVIYDEN